jgi:hypothetical protein
VTRLFGGTWQPHLVSITAKVIVAAVVVGTSACGSSPRPQSVGVVTLAAGPVSRYRSVTASGPTGAVELTGDLRDAVVPLRAARAFAQPQPLPEYGLDRPQGRLRYQPERGAPVELALGGLTFDARGIYVSRPGDARVFLVFVDRLRPVLNAVGIEVPVQAEREPAAP